MRIVDPLFPRARHTLAAIREDAYRLRAAQLRAEAVEPKNLRRRSLMFYAAYEYELLADKVAEAAEWERSSAARARVSDRRRRGRGEPRTHGGRMS